jgi:GAF domain-containing protein
LQEGPPLAAPDPSDLIPRHLVRAFAETAQYIYASEDLGETLRRVADAAVDLVPACDLASITVRDGAAFTTLGATHPRALAADEAQYSTDEGPCLSAIREDPLVRTPDASADDRWPRLAAELGDAPIGAAVSCRLSVPDGAGARAIGSLNAYSAAVDAFDERDVDLVLLLGAHAGVVLHAAQQARNLRQALESRDAIGQAKGILMERERITADQAFDRLRTMSQRMNVKLRWLAEQLVLTGEAEPGAAPARAPTDAPQTPT